MENANKQICRLCLELIPDSDYEVFEEGEKEILDTLLIKIDFDISDNAVSCKKCLMKLQDCYEFKLNCFYMNDYITPFMDADVKVDIKNVSERVTKTSENVNLDNSQICRLCTSFIEDEAFNCYTSNLKDMIEKCFPEVNLNSIDEPLVCKPCLSNVMRYYEFMKSCEEVEQKIKNYIQKGEDRGIASKIILEDILGLKNCGTLSKPLEKQCLNVENETECLKIEEAANIKCEEIEIKDELDIDSDQCTFSNRKGHLQMHKRVHQKDDIRQMYRCKLCDYQAKNSISLKDHMIRVHTDPSKVQTLQCSFCPYKSILKSTLSQHTRKHHIERVKCDKCDFRTNLEENLSQHMKVHETGKAPVFKCNKCEYSTWRKRNLYRHKITHRDPSNAQTFKCALCPYESTAKAYLYKHITRCHNHKDQLAFECTLCLYVTKVKENLRKHLRTHEFIPSIKCDQCDFSTKRKRNLQQHMKRHESVKCDKCEYSTWRKGNLKKHKVMHMEPRQDIAYKCKLCDYQAKANITLKNHMILNHTDPSKVPKFKCALCPYEGTIKDYLSKHIKRYHNPKDQSTLRHMKVHDTVKSPTFKCDKCEYSTWRKYNLNQHKLRHMELSETIAYKCTTCNFQTKYKRKLKDHIKRCLKKNDEKSTIG